jgi:hypothetical protein
MPLPKQTTHEGGISLDMFPRRFEAPTSIERDSYDVHMRKLMKDRRDVAESNIEAYTAPLSTNQINQRMTLHTYGALNTNDPWVDENFDTQFHSKDPNGVMLDNVQWQNYLRIARKHVENFDFAKSGAYNGDSGTYFLGQYLSDWNKSKLWLQSLYKNFKEGLDTLNPRGLFMRDKSKVPKLYYGALNSQEVPIQKTNIPQAISRIVPRDVHFRSATVPTQDPGIGAYGHGIKSAGHISLKQQERGIASGIVDEQISQNVTFNPPITRDPMNAVNTIMKNSLAIDDILQQQEIATNKKYSWIPHHPLMPINDTYDSYTQQTLLPNVTAKFNTANNMDNVQYEQGGEQMTNRGMAYTGHPTHAHAQQNLIDYESDNFGAALQQRPVTRATPMNQGSAVQVYDTDLHDDYLLTGRSAGAGARGRTGGGGAAGGARGGAQHHSDFSHDSYGDSSLAMNQSVAAPKNVHKYDNVLSEQLYWQNSNTQTPQKYAAVAPIDSRLNTQLYDKKPDNNLYNTPRIGISAQETVSRIDRIINSALSESQKVTLVR